MTNFKINQINAALQHFFKITENEAYSDYFQDVCKIAVKALEKQIPKKPTIYTDTRDLFDCCGDVIGTYETDVCECPNCGEYLIDKDALEEFPWLLKYNYCNACGQALDWGQEDDR